MTCDYYFSLLLFSHPLRRREQSLTHVSLIHGDVEMCGGTLHGLIDVIDDESDVDRWRFEAVRSCDTGRHLRQPQHLETFKIQERRRLHFDGSACEIE